MSCKQFYAQLEVIYRRACLLKPLCLPSFGMQREKESLEGMHQKGVCSLFSDPTLRRPLVLAFGLHIGQQLCGINAVCETPSKLAIGHVHSLAFWSKQKNIREWCEKYQHRCFHTRWEAESITSWAISRQTLFQKFSTLHQGRTPPLEAVLVIFGRRALIFFVWKLLKKYEKWHHFCAHAQWWSPWRRKNVEKGHLAPSNLSFFSNCDRRKRFSHNERRRADLQNFVSDVLIFA